MGVVEVGPDGFGHREVEAREDDVALWQAGRGGHEAGEGAEAAGGAGDDDGVGRRGALPGFGLRFEEGDAAGGGVDQAAGGELAGPVGGDDLHEVQGVGPVLGVALGDEGRKDAIEGDAFAVRLVQQAGEFGRQQPGAVGGGGGRRSGLRAP